MIPDCCYFRIEKSPFILVGLLPISKSKNTICLKNGKLWTRSKMFFYYEIRIKNADRKHQYHFLIFHRKYYIYEMDPINGWGGSHSMSSRSCRYLVPTVLTNFEVTEKTRKKKKKKLKFLFDFSFFFEFFLSLRNNI